MSTHKNHNHAKPEQGSVRSYVTGFMLSLLFTAIPYYLVVDKTLSGNSLIAAILGFALLQMLVQIYFFLHLGRGPKPLYNIVFFASTIGLILVVVCGSMFIMEHLHYNMAPSELPKKIAEDEGIYQMNGMLTGACQGVHDNHIITISNGTVDPLHVDAQYCDTLTFVNRDEQTRSLTFGTHPNHGTYGGESEIVVRNSRPGSVTLNQLGSYQYHDHQDSNVAGHFTVSPR